MPIIVNLDVMLAKRKMKSKDLAEIIGEDVLVRRIALIFGTRVRTLARNIARH